MRITSVELNGWKGIDGTFQLAERTLLTGPNGSGKSAIIQGIAFVATGGTVVGRTNEAAATMFRDGQGAVTLHLSDGSSIGRMIRPGDGDSKSAYQQFIQVNGRTVPKLKGEATILAALGDFAPQFDLRSFLGLKAEARRQFVLDLMSASVPPTPATEFWAGLVMDGAAAQRIQMDLLKKASKPITADVLGETLDWLTERVNESKRDVDSQEKTARELHIRTESGGEPPHVIRQRIAALQVGIDDLNGQIGEHYGQAESWKRTCGRVAWLREQLAGTPASGGQGAGTDAGPLEARAADLERQAAELDAAEVTGKDLPGLSEKFRLARIEVTALEYQGHHLRSNLDSAHDRVRIAETAVEILKARIAEAEKSPWARAMTMAMACECCCHESSELRILIGGQLDRSAPTGLPEAEIALNDAERLRGEARIAHDAAIEAINAAKSNRDNLGEQCESNSATVVNAKLQVAALRVEAVNARHEAATIRTNAESEAKQLAEWESDLSNLEASLSNAPPAALDDLDIVLARKRLDLGEAKTALETAMDAESVAASAVKANARAEEARVEHEGYKAVREAVRAERDRRIGDMLRLILGPLDGYLGGVLTGAAAYCDLVSDTGRPTFVIGWVRGGQRVPIEAMSGGEAAMFGCGLVYALVSMSTSPIKLLIIDGGELDFHRLVDVVRCITKLTGYDQTIIASHLRVEDVSGWDVMRLTATGQEAPCN